MKVKGMFAGTVSSTPEIIAPTTAGKKPFLAFSMESPDSYSQYPNRLKVVAFGQGIDTLKASLSVGTMVAVDGELSAESYISQKTQKPVGVLKMFAKSVEVISATAAAPAQESSEQPAPAATTTANDDVPF
jgi:single-stranded DNA-binding protein